VVRHESPVPTVDAVIHIPGRGVVLVKRRFDPPGWALPGGFVDYGETVEAAAIREAKEETGLTVELTGLLGVYSDPRRDRRRHTISVVFTAQCLDPDELAAGDDAGDARVFPLDRLPEPLAFDHARILDDYARLRRKYNPASA
jgi:8-oxo-dGTP diphosphatase